MFEKEINYIETDWIKEITKQLTGAIPPYFYDIPASSTGKYHPSYATGEKGLYRHTQAACKICYDMLNLEYWREMFTQQERDFAIAALIFHDTCKSGLTYDKWTKHEHPLLAANNLRDSVDRYLNEVNLEDIQIPTNLYRQYLDNVCPLIESHMGEWNTNIKSPFVTPKPDNDLAQLVHLADYLASRKYLEVTNDIFLDTF